MKTKGSLEYYRKGETESDSTTNRRTRSSSLQTSKITCIRMEIVVHMSSPLYSGLEAVVGSRVSANHEDADRERPRDLPSGCALRPAVRPVSSRFLLAFEADTAYRT